LTVRPRLADQLLVAAAVLGFLFVVLAVHTGASPSGPTVSRTAVSGPTATATSSRSAQQDIRPNVSPQHRHGWGFIGRAVKFLLRLALTLAVVLVAGAIVSRLLNLKWSRRSHQRRAPPPDEVALKDLAGSVSRVIDDTLAGVHRRQADSAIISCWIRLEELATGVGVRPAPSGTSTELVGRLVAELPVSQQPLDRLAALYREARFSRHRMTPELIEQARTDLEQLRGELRDARTGRGGER
jgi:hypothetical protein